MSRLAVGSAIRQGLEYIGDFFGILIMGWPVVLIITVLFALFGFIGWIFWGTVLSAWLLWSAGIGFVISMFLCALIFAQGNIQ
jgi:hypothetical protein